MKMTPFHSSLSKIRLARQPSRTKHLQRIGWSCSELGATVGNVCLAPTGGLLERGSNFWCRGHMLWASSAPGANAFALFDWWGRTSGRLWTEICWDNEKSTIPLTAWQMWTDSRPNTIDVEILVYGLRTAFCVSVHFGWSTRVDSWRCKEYWRKRAQYCNCRQMFCQ